MAWQVLFFHGYNFRFEIEEGEALKQEVFVLVENSLSQAFEWCELIKDAPIFPDNFFVKVTSRSESGEKCFCFHAIEGKEFFGLGKFYFVFSDRANSK